MTRGTTHEVGKKTRMKSWLAGASSRRGVAAQLAFAGLSGAVPGVVLMLNDVWLALALNGARQLTDAALCARAG